MPFPWIAILASTLANKMNSDRERQMLGTDLRRQQAQKLGGNTAQLDALLGRKQIENNESNAMSNMLIQQLVGQMGNQKPPSGTPVTNSQLRGAVGGTGLADPQSDLDDPYDPNSRALSPMYGGSDKGVYDEVEKDLRKRGLFR